MKEMAETLYLEKALKKTAIYVKKAKNGWNINEKTTTAKIGLDPGPLASVAAAVEDDCQLSIEASCYYPWEACFNYLRPYPPGLGPWEEVRKMGPNAAF
jgi:hypothetical protein